MVGKKPFEAPVGAVTVKSALIPKAVDRFLRTPAKRGTQPAAGSRSRSVRGVTWHGCLRRHHMIGCDPKQDATLGPDRHPVVVAGVLAGQRVDVDPGFVARNGVDDMTSHLGPVVVILPAVNQDGAARVALEGSSLPVAAARC